MNLEFSNCMAILRQFFTRKAAKGEQESPQAKENIVLPFLSRRRRAVGKKIAVVVHVYYPELMAEIAPLLKNLPSGFSLYIKTQTDEAKAFVEKTLARQKLQASITCRVGPNRGRNFSTLFVEFARVISKYDYVLHLHTKKSLHSGEEKKQWRSSLFNGLVGSKRLVNSIIENFETMPDVGLIYPQSKDMPYWAHHWLSNGHLKDALMRRLGVTDFQRDGYFSYPIGGMFWARTDAIRPFLKAKFSYKDFPEENGQTDGTLAHSIERAVGLVANAIGYSFLEYIDEQKLFRKNWSTFNLGQYRNNTPQMFRGILPSINLVSFDLFDTVLMRSSLSPDSVIKYTGQVIERKYPAAKNFFERRKDAENSARAAKEYRGDVNIDEIYAHIKSDADWTPAIIKIAAGLEKKFDAATLNPRPEVVELVRLAKSTGKRVIVISDTYYRIADIRYFLRRAGLSKLFDKIYLSSEEEARKDRGDLWSKVMKAENVQPPLWLHVGDNEQSDIQACCDRKIKFFHVMQPLLLLKTMGFKELDSSVPSAWVPDLVLGPAMRKLASSPFPGNNFLTPQKISRAEDLGYVVLGPVIFTFLAWLAQQARKRNISHLYFLSREGWLLFNAYKALFSKLKKSELPTASYLYVSRRSTIAASLAITYDPNRIIAGRGGFRGSIGELLKHRIGLTLNKKNALQRCSVALPDDNEKVLAYIHQMRIDISKHSQSEFDRIYRYFCQEKMFDHKKIGVVDIGYGGTIQTCMQEIIEGPLTGFYFGTSDEIQQVRFRNGNAFGCFSSEIRADESNSPILKNSLMMESFLTAPHGQVLTYAKKKRAMMPICKPSSFDKQGKLELKRIHDGATQYIIDILDIYGRDLLFSSYDTEMAQEFYRLLVEKKIQVNSKIGSALHVEDQFCGNDIYRNLVPEYVN